MKLKIHNVQSIKNTTLEFPEGITFITGPGNSGKTAVFRALGTLLLNPAGSADLIGYSDSKMSVNMEIDGHTINFQRDKSKTDYVINGKKYSKLGRSNLFDILPEMHKYFIYNEEDPRKIINFQTEDDKIFPFDRSAPEMFRLFEKILGCTNTKGILELIKKENDSISFKLTNLTSEKLNLQTSVDILNECLGELDLHKMKVLCESINTLQEEIRRLNFRIARINSYIPILKLATEIPKLQVVDWTVFENLKITKQTLERVTKLNAIVSSYEKPIVKTLSEIEFQELSKTKYLLDKVNDLQSKTTLEISKVDIYKKQLETLDKELSEFTVCPLCGQQMENDICLTNSLPDSRKQKQKENK